MFGDQGLKKHAVVFDLVTQTQDVAFIERPVVDREFVLTKACSPSHVDVVAICVELDAGDLPTVTYGSRWPFSYTYLDASDTSSPGIPSQVAAVVT